MSSFNSQSPTPQAMSSTPLKNTLTSRYVFTLSLIAILSIVAFFSLRYMISTQKGDDAAAINVSGRQRMLSQRIALFSLQLVNSETAVERETNRIVLAETVNLFAESHRGLLDGGLVAGFHGSPGIALPGNPSTALKAIYFDAPENLDTQIANYVESARALLNASDEKLTLDNPDLIYILSASSAKLIDSLNRAVSLYQLESEEAVTRLATVETFVLVITLSLLISTGLFIFRPLVNQIQQHTQELELSNKQLAVQIDKVQERTHDLTLVTEVNQRIFQVRDLDTLLAEAVELIRSHFGLYYTQIYLANEEKRSLTLRSGTGSVGAELVRRGHRLLIGPGSINGRAAGERQAIFVSDTTQSRSFLPNPLLPGTKSEMAIPLLVGDRIIGVLNLQHSEADTFTGENLPAFEVLAGQMAIAIDNAHLFNETTQAQTEIEEQARRTAHASWRDFLNAVDRQERIAYTYDLKEIDKIEGELPTSEDAQALEVPIEVMGEKLGVIQLEGREDQTWAEIDIELIGTVAAQVAQQIDNLRLLAEAERYRAEAEDATRRLTREGWETFLETTAPSQDIGYIYDLQQVSSLAPTHLETDGQASTFAQPITVRGEALGKLEVGTPEEQADFDEETVELVTAVAEQLSAHLENLRLLEETERGQAQLDKRAQELATVAQVSTTASTEMDVNQLLQSVVDLTKESFNLYHAHVYLMDDDQENLILTAGAGKVGRQMVAQGWQIPAGREQSLVAQAARSRQGVVVNNVQAAPGFLPNPLLPNTNSEMAVPLLVGDQVLGVLDVQADRADAFSNEDVSIQTTLASQVAVALQNAAQFEQTQLALADSRQLARAVETSVDAVVITNQKGAIQFVNPAFERITGYTAAEALGGNPSLLNSGQKGEEFYRKMWTTILSGQIWNDEVVNKRKNGSLYEAELTISPLLDEGGSITQFVAVQRDITARKQAEEAVRLALTRTDELYNISQSINNAVSEVEMLEALAKPAVEAGANSVDMMYIDMDSAGNPEWAEIVATWQLEGKAPIPVGTRFYLPDLPFAKFWLADPNKPLLISNVITDTRIDDATKAAIKQTGIQALAIIPLIQMGEQVGLVNLDWDQPHEFSQHEKEIYSAIIGLASPAVHSRRLFEQAQTRAQREQALSQITASVRASTDPATIMRVAVRELGIALGRKTEIRVVTAD